LSSSMHQPSDTHTGSNEAITEPDVDCVERRHCYTRTVHCSKMSPPFVRRVWFLAIYLAYPVYILPATGPAILEESQRYVNI
jgi:hypothetical protein